MNMISVITTTYNTPLQVLARTYASLKLQKYNNWEWVIYDDSTNDNVFNQVYGFCSDERYKIRYIRPNVPSFGNIGYAKKTAFGAAFGDILVELDHDDELTTDALLEINNVFNNKQIGFCYSDWSEIFPDGSSGKYPEGWAFGYGSEYWSDEYKVWVMSSPEINRITLSHIVSVPNHVRCWRKNVYHQIGGHDPSLVISDDYDLILRTFLSTKTYHIKKLLYKQHISPNTEQRKRNGLIQELVPKIHNKYSSQLDKLFNNL